MNRDSEMQRELEDAIQSAECRLWHEESKKRIEITNKMHVDYVKNMRYHETIEELENKLFSDIGYVLCCINYSELKIEDFQRIRIDKFLNQFMNEINKNNINWWKRINAIWKIETNEIKRKY